MPAIIKSASLRAGTAFPYLFLTANQMESQPMVRGFKIMHWHDECQLIFAEQGPLTIQFLSGTVPLQEGEGIFINKQVPHQILRAASSLYKSILFPETLLTFGCAGPAAFVSSVTGNPNFFYCCLTPKDPALENALVHLKALAALKDPADPAGQYRVLVHLTSLWMAMAPLLSEIPPQRESPTARRMPAFLQYISFHYGEKLTLSGIAASAHVGKSECLRCFRTALGTTPLQYVKEYRLAQAASLLRSTDLPIAEAAAQCGFSDPSHFSQCFREKTGLSPRAYRNSHRSSGNRQ